MAERDLNRLAKLLSRLIAEYHCCDDTGDVICIVRDANFRGEYAIPGNVISLIWMTTITSIAPKSDAVGIRYSGDHFLAVFHKLVIDRGSQAAEVVRDAIKRRAWSRRARSVRS